MNEQPNRFAGKFTPFWRTDQASRTALVVGFKRELDVGDLQKIVSIALRKQLNFGIASRLSEKVVAFSRHGHRFAAPT